MHLLEGSRDLPCTGHSLNVHRNWARARPTPGSRTELNTGISSGRYVQDGPENLMCIRRKLDQNRARIWTQKRQLGIQLITSTVFASVSDLHISKTRGSTAVDSTTPERFRHRWLSDWEEGSPAHTVPGNCQLPLYKTEKLLWGLIQEPKFAFTRTRSWLILAFSNKHS